MGQWEDVVPGGRIRLCLATSCRLDERAVLLLVYHETLLLLLFVWKKITFYFKTRNLIEKANKLLKNCIDINL